MRRLTFAPLAMLFLASTAAAQEQRSTVEIRPFAGVYAPLGAQHDMFHNAPLFGLQGALEIRPNFHLVGELSWVPATLRIESTNDNAYVFSQALGIELDLVRELSSGWVLKPFIGAGGGIRNFLYRADEFKSRGGPAGYAALGTEMQVGSIALRLEGRGHVFRYRSPVKGSDTVVRRDLTVQMGVAYHLW